MGVLEFKTRAELLKRKPKSLVGLGDTVDIVSASDLKRYCLVLIDVLTKHKARIIDSETTHKRINDNCTQVLCNLLTWLIAKSSTKTLISFIRWIEED